MAKPLDSTLLLPLLLLTFSLTIETSWCDPRTQVVQFKCGSQLEHNRTQFMSNFISTMDSISSQMRTTGFGQVTVGSGPDANFGLAQCHGDLTLLDCVLCYAQMRTLLPSCFPYNAGTVYLDGCFMRVQNYSFYDEISGVDDNLICGNRTVERREYGEAVRRELKGAVERAVAESGGGFGRGGEGEGSGEWRSGVLRGGGGLGGGGVFAGTAGGGGGGGGGLHTGCFVRYSDVDFLNEVVGSGGGGGRSRVSGKVIAVIVVLSVAVLLLGATMGVYVLKQRRMRQKRKALDYAVEMEMAITLHNSLKFEYSTLQKATKSFSSENKLGQGGFGMVYKGSLADGREIAVKRLFLNNRHRATDFFNEVNIIGSVQHKNLVRLLGCSCFGPESLLVYEFLANQSLERFIFDPILGKELDWDKRFEIIVGTAEGLAYLHENSEIRIIHRDIKASNILLDARFKAKIADFGLARTFQEDKSHISTVIAGTLGYMAPEYLAHGQLTEKADVYSFGVLLLEIVTGMQNNNSKGSEFSDSVVVSPDHVEIA
ncbi:hypothetical protein Scep_021264 [Stephania cephalantha]|uniref:Cysteine-rich receptor-like protein kinase 2 n=1 Tax=Stephania cephalantha TaxID=152367 RepID=A0AAP0F5S1_9MAGN